jgi:Domain of unknown function (DUF4383)
MNTRTLATVFGLVFVLVGIVGFFSSPPPSDAPPLALAHGHGLALGLFPVNTLHNLIHIGFGLVGLLAARGAVMSAKGYFQFLAVAYGLLTVLGLLPATQTTFGLVPIWGNDVWLHGLIAVVAGIIGFTTVAESVTARA